MHRDKTDLIVVGGGPAGSSAAITAARAGLDVVVIDKATFPRDKCCGDGLTTGALRRLDQLGLDPGSVPSWRVITDAVVHSPSGHRVRFPLPGVDSAATGVFAAVARRRELDAALLELAEKEGAKLMTGHELIGVDNGSDTVTAECRGPDGEATLTAPNLIAADGMWSPTRKLLGLHAPGYRGDWHAFRQYYTDVSPEAATELTVWFEPDLLPGYVWSFPIGQDGANVGFGIVRSDDRPVQFMKQLWAEILRRPHIASFLGTDAKPEQPHRAWPIPARLGDLPLTAGRVMFVGDAAAATDPMTGEGIGQAIETGGDAARAVVASGPLDPTGACATYEDGLRRSMVKDHGMARALSGVLSSRFGADASVRIAGATGWTRRNFARWLFEDYPRATLLTPHRWRRGVFTSPGAYAD